MRKTREEIRDYIQLGYQNNKVQIIFAEPETNDGYSGIVCKIGNQYIYFAGETGEEYTNVYDYIRDTSEEDNIDKITDAFMSLSDHDFKNIDGSYLNITAITCYFELEKHLKNKYEALQLWKELEDIPVDENEKLDTDWYIRNKGKNFRKGTHREEIWHWLEETFNVSIAKDLMGF